MRLESREGSHHSPAEDAGRTWQSLRPESNSWMFLRDYSPYIPAQLPQQFLGTKLGTNKTSNPGAQAVSTLDANLPEPNLERANTRQTREARNKHAVQWGEPEWVGPASDQPRGRAGVGWARHRPARHGPRTWDSLFFFFSWSFLPSSGNSERS